MYCHSCNKILFEWISKTLLRRYKRYEYFGILLSLCCWCHVDYMMEDIFAHRRSAEPLMHRRTLAGLAALYTAVSCFLLEMLLLLFSR